MNKELKDKVLHLLSTEEQVDKVLVRHRQASDGYTILKGYCYCIQGILGLALGGAVSLKERRWVHLKLDQIDYSRLLPDKILVKHNIPLDFKAEFVLDILKPYLTNQQTYDITSLKNKGHKIGWIELNDTIGLTFKQFSYVIEAIEDNG